MRRADRLFRIVEFLKSRKHAVRAQELADDLEVSIRTVYRDIADLISAGTPIYGEAGVGYQLDRQHILRPLMFSVDEIEALMLGTEMVKSWGDKELSQAAAGALDKIRSVLPAQRAGLVADSVLFAMPTAQKPKIDIDVAVLRRAIRSRNYVRFQYENERKQKSERDVRPLCLAFFAPVWLLLGWCEVRQDFRNFRLDRVEEFVVLDRHFIEEEGKRLRDYLKFVS